ncbi:MAG: SCP2 sterol-binding domain-containing protein [Eubacteriales bacterium]
MKVLIVYGGKGFKKDPTLIVIERIAEVFNELNVDIEQTHLYKEKDNIKITDKLSDYEGIILATTVDWLGIGGLMQSFLDDCWYYADKSVIKDLYMMPLVCSTVYGERDAENHLLKAWDLLGGITCEGICGYIPNIAEVETNEDYLMTIGKKIEAFYRVIKQKRKALPKSTSKIQQNNINSESTLQDNEEDDMEQLTFFANNEQYIKRQQEDIQELSTFFKEKLSNNNIDIYEEIIQAFKEHFYGMLVFKGSYKINITDKKRELIIVIDKENLDILYDEDKNADVIIQTTYELLNKIINGHMTFQRAFMTGSLTAKGDFKQLYTLDQLFRFK